MALATATKTKATGEGQIRALIDERVKAVRTKDVDAGMSNIAPEIMWFDVANPLQHVGSDSIRKRAEEWFSSFQGPIGYEVRDLRIAVGDEVAFSHSLDRFSGTKTDGGEINMWVRRTVCYRKVDGKWRVAHEHGSVPFDAGSGKASLDLKP